jgi:hypothetical protein
MRDHRSLLGTLFVVWAVIQGVTGVAMAIAGTVEITFMFWFVLAVSVAIYAWVGLQLRGGAQLRLAAGILSALALLSIPIGTALGIYGLWVVLRAPGWQSPRPPEAREARPPGGPGEHERPV